MLNVGIGVDFLKADKYFGKAAAQDQVKVNTTMVVAWNTAREFDKLSRLLCTISNWR
jgi:hypothetical protein